MKVDNLENDVKQAVEAGLNIREKVRDITLNALKDGYVDTDSIREVANKVIEGAKLGVTAQRKESQELLAQATSGLDDAISRIAEASKLALEEAVSRGEEFKSHELSKTLEDIKALESLFIETLNNAAQTGQEQASSILNDLAKHAERTGTAVGEELKEGVTLLSEKIAQLGQNQIEIGAATAKKTGTMMAGLISGLLEGAADSLSPINKLDKKSDNKN